MSLEAGEYELSVRGDLGAARACFEAAYQEAHEPESTAAAALGLSGLWVHEHRTVSEAATVRGRQVRALSLIDAGSPLALRLRARLAAEEDYRAGSHTAILALLPQVRRYGDAVALAEALRMAYHCAMGPPHGELRAALVTELIAQAPRTGRRCDPLMASLLRTVDLFMAGDPGAKRALGELRSHLTAADHLAAGFVAAGLEVMLAIRSGRLRHAEQLASACARLGAAAGDHSVQARHLGQLATIRWYQGRIGELVPLLSELVNSRLLGATDNSFFAILAAAAATVGQRRLAKTMLARLCGRDLAAIPRTSSWLVTMYCVAEAAFLLRDATISAQAYPLLAPYAHLPVLASFGVTCLGSVQHALGVLALTGGDSEAAVEHLRAAVQDNLALGHAPAAALSRARLAQARTLASGGAVTLPSEEPALVLRRQGGGWRLAMNDRAMFVAHSVGMDHLARLLASPGRPIAAGDLAAAARPESRPGDGERVRIAVGRAIRRALDRVTETDPAIGATLRARITTGATCCYRGTGPSSWPFG
ncbi:hypothetical protein ACIBG8_03920 [Nonomuraea sp. NPDC050556]|uniref:hypothetical protein n=1 Tax=Nonomuraea sp. NPDC050556 TaxID=3364369 RepID=UPI003796FCAC